jgi:hypothetical protein
MDENNHHSLSTQNFQKLPKNDRRDMNVKKSFSLFSIKQPLSDSTNKDNQEQQSLNSTINQPVQYRRQSKTDFTTGNY